MVAEVEEETLAEVVIVAVVVDQAAGMGEGTIEADVIGEGMILMDLIMIINNDQMLTLTSMVSLLLPSNHTRAEDVEMNHVKKLVLVGQDHLNHHVVHRLQDQIRAPCGQASMAEFQKVLIVFRI